MLKIEISECIVSEWGTWSKCHGGCQKGLIVRNRDVLQPPLQELTSEGRMMQRLCPHLYETKYCDQTTCGMENTVRFCFQFCFFFNFNILISDVLVVTLSKF